jgi:hypothetical protein
MDDESDIRLVDAHPEGDGGDDGLEVAGNPAAVNFRSAAGFINKFASVEH